MTSSSGPDLKRALRPVPTYERAVREVSAMLAAAGVRHALAGALAANAYRVRPRTTEDIDFLVGHEAFEKHAGGFVTMRVPVVEFDGEGESLFSGRPSVCIDCHDNRKSYSDWVYAFELPR